MRARGEAIRSRKKMESDLNDLEVQVQHSKRLAEESQKQTKTLSSQLKEMVVNIYASMLDFLSIIWVGQCQISNHKKEAVVNHDDCCRVTEDLKEQSTVAERRVNLMNSEIEVI